MLLDVVFDCVCPTMSVHVNVHAFRCGPQMFKDVLLSVCVRLVVLDSLLYAFFLPRLALNPGMSSRDNSVIPTRQFDSFAEHKHTNMLIAQMFVSMMWWP